MVPPIPVGTLLRQRYLLQEILGQGGFGRTYLAIDQERFNERCVLKEFSVPFQDESLIYKSQALFQREASTLHQIQHPQVPRFWAAFEENQRLFLVQDFVEGPTYRQLLGDRSRQGNTFTESEVRYLLRHILPVLDYLHEKNIVHRDISPENIILKPSPDTGAIIDPSLSETGLPVLIDFGAVKAVTAQLLQTSSITRVGKVGYAPPEQLQTGRVYPNSDLYALAATCLVLLTGKEAKTLVNSQTLKWQWSPQTNISEDLAFILKRMLAVYPGERYATAKEVLDDLQPLADLSQASTELLSAHAQTIADRFGKSASVNLPEVQNFQANSTALPNQPALRFSTLLKRATADEASFKRRRRKEQPVYSSLRPAKKSPLKYWVAAAFLLGTGVSGVGFWQLSEESSKASGEVWVSGAKLPQSEVPRVIGSPGVNSGNSVASSPGGASPSLSNSIVRATADPQPIQFPPGKISTMLQGNLQAHSLQPYVLQATQGQILTVTLEGAGVVMNILRSNQEGVDAAAYQTRNWTGQLPSNDQYTIQVSGSGSYMLDVAVTPGTRPTQETTERVTFARGTNGTTVTGDLAPKQIRRYLVKATQGQIVLAKVLQGRVMVSAIAPDGQRIGGTSLTSKDWKGRLPMDGDYVLELSTLQSTDYALSVEVF
jgi:serine/threonine protein kinase